MRSLNVKFMTNSFFLHAFEGGGEVIEIIKNDVIFLYLQARTSPVHLLKYKLSGFVIKGMLLRRAFTCSLTFITHAVRGRPDFDTFQKSLDEIFRMTSNEV